MTGHYIVKLNNMCNANCVFCADSQEIRKQPDIPLTKLLTDLKENRKRFDSILISGGEPLIYKNLIEYLKAAKSLGYKRINITTNGFLLAYPDFAKQLSEYVDSFTLSFQTHDSKKYHAITKIRDSFALVMKGIKNLNKLGMEYGVNTVIHKLNYTDLDKTVELLIRNNVSYIQLAFMNPIDDSAGINVNKKSIYSVSYNEIKEHVKRALTKAKFFDFPRIAIENIPICVMPEYMNQISDLKKPEENKDYYNASKQKAPKCESCIHNDICDGVWKDYLRQEGDKELKPIIKIPFENQTFEWAGLEKGFKEASIFYTDRFNLKNLIKIIKEKDYFYEVADFAYDFNNGISKLNTDIKHDSLISVYVSKDPLIVKRIKELDISHQKQENPEAFYEIGKMLGYPKCCTEHIKNIHMDKKYEKRIEGYGTDYDDETIYPVLTYEESTTKSYILNNVRSPNIINFYVCNYNCKEARKVAQQVLDYMKENGIETKDLKISLQRPLIFFGHNRHIIFEDGQEDENKITYSKVLKHTVDDEMGSALKIGNQIIMQPDSIKIYNQSDLIFTYKKKHEYDGIFMTFGSDDS